MRRFKGETNNDKNFARDLSELADVYVNDAFDVSHREHASIVGLPKLMPSFMGLQMEAEINNLSRAFKPA